MVVVGEVINFVLWACILLLLARFVIDRMRVHPQAELCIKAVDEDTIAELNEQWMEKEGPTDVLAFPMDELRPGLVNEEPEEGVLGDLVLCAFVSPYRSERCSQATGRFPKSISRKVPPPMEVANAIMITPNGSSRFSMAAKAPEMAKAIVPKISMILKKLE